MPNPVTPEFLDALAATLPEGALRPAEPRHREEPRGRWRAAQATVALPRDTDQVAAIVRACAASGVGLVPWGGGTGLVGGQVAGEGHLILSLERMNRIRAILPEENVLVAEAGCILADVQAAADHAGRLFPLTLASQGSCTIGGNLAANAGGVNVLRYGNARDLCLGVEAVLADGSVHQGLTRLRKDNAGYDLRGLLVGSEGTLGIITAACLRLFPKPVATGAAFVVVPDPAAALGLLALANDRLGGMVSAFELIARQGLDFLAETMPQVRQPFADPPAWMVLIDLGCPTAIDPAGALEALFEDAAERRLTLDGVVAQSAAQRDDFWTLREALPEANRRIGSISSHDISVPLGVIPDFIARAGAALAGLGDWRVNCFGHVGDGNLHYNVFPAKGRTRAEEEGSRPAIKTLVHDIVHDMGGSVSAEHGVGRLKAADLERYADPAKLAAMRAIKAALDPKGILNPGAVLLNEETPPG